MSSLLGSLDPTLSLSEILRQRGMQPGAQLGQPGTQGAAPQFLGPPAQQGGAPKPIPVPWAQPPAPGSPPQFLGPPVQQGGAPKLPPAPVAPPQPPGVAPGSGWGTPPPGTLPPIMQGGPPQPPMSRNPPPVVGHPAGFAIGNPFAPVGGVRYLGPPVQSGGSQRLGDVIGAPRRGMY